MLELEPGLENPTMTVHFCLLRAAVGQFLCLLGNMREVHLWLF